MNNKYNYWAPWHKLKTTILGKFYSPEFQDVDTFQSKAQMNRQVTTGILISLQYINKYILNLIEFSM